MFSGVIFSVVGEGVSCRISDELSDSEALVMDVTSEIKIVLSVLLNDFEPIISG